MSPTREHATTPTTRGRVLTGLLASGPLEQAVASDRAVSGMLVELHGERSDATEGVESFLIQTSNGAQELADAPPASLIGQRAYVRAPFDGQPGRHRDAGHQLKAETHRRHEFTRRRLVNAQEGSSHARR